MSLSGDTGPHFELTVLGCSGGPLERHTCAYLLKPSNLRYDEIIQNSQSNRFICIDAGSGLSGMADWISKCKSGKLMSENSLLALYADSDPVQEYTHCPTSVPFDEVFLAGVSPLQTALKLVELLQNYLVTHAHADHILGLVVNSPCFTSKTINGSAKTLEILQNDVFNNRVWPRLESLYFREVQLEPNWTVITDDFRVKPFINSHGCFLEGHRRIQYQSNAYLINYHAVGKNVLVFGDLEPDLLSRCSNNAYVWEQVSPLIRDRSLAAVVIECSNFNLPSGVPLYGHMTPDYLVQEFCSLQQMLQTHGTSLEGLHVIITHVKETGDASDPRKRILHELQELNQAHGLGLVFTIALPGLTYSL